MTHYRRLKRTGTTTRIIFREQKCKAPDCENNAYGSDGLCHKHSVRVKKWGDYCGSGIKPLGGLYRGKMYYIWHNMVHKPERGGVDYLPWLDFLTFYNDVGDPPHDDLYFVKKNPRHGFGPDNWEWHHNHCANRD